MVPFMLEGMENPGPPLFAGDGSRKLDVYRAGNLAILKDPTGEWLTEAYSQGGNALNWILGSLYGAFYRHFEDDYQYLTIVIVRDFNIFAAFYSPMANDTYGIGYDSVTPGEMFDTTTDSQVEGMIFMNYAGLWIDDPELGRYVFGQEFMHRWGAFVNVEKEGVDENALLGRDTAHWSFWFNTTNSPMEGNAWVDNGDGTWSTDRRAESTFSDLDMYLMGLVGPEEVGTQTLLALDPADERASGMEAASPPIYYVNLTQQYNNVTVPATAIDIELDDIIAAEGERVPSVQDSPKGARMAFLVLVLSDDDVQPEFLTQIDTMRQTFEADWEEDTRGLFDLDTTLGDGDATAWPGYEEDTGDTDPPADDSGAPVADEDDDKGEDPAGGCGCGTVPNEGVGAAFVGLAALALVRRRVTRAG